MAAIGMRHIVAAKVNTEVEGSALTYSAGKDVGAAISCNVTFDRDDNPLYADDVITENDYGVRNASFEIEIDHLSDEVTAYLLNDTTDTTGTPTEYDVTDKAAPYVGFGFMRVLKKGSDTTYQALWFHKAQFGLNSMNSQTKGENIEWQTATLSGRIFGVHNDSSGDAKYYRRASFSTAASAAAWLDTKASISRS